MKSIAISVRTLVEHTLRGGSLDSSFKGKNAMVEGTKIHQKFQNDQADNYYSEVRLKHGVEFSNFLFELEGRADGIIVNEETVIIDEIKSTILSKADLIEGENTHHWAQAKIYAYLLFYNNDVIEKLGIADTLLSKEVTIRLTYIHRGNSECSQFLKVLAFKDLEIFVFSLLKKYLDFAKYRWNHLKKRKSTLKKLKFPYDSYRPGQRELAITTYRSIKNENRLFTSAPTGIGKTISTLFPALKAVGEGLADRIYYLSAKNVTQKVALDTARDLLDNGLNINALNITAKERICFMKECNCNKDYCKYANGYFDRLNDALLDILTNNFLLNREIIEEYSKKHVVCPFEFSLDLSMLSDLVICDYNYVFDPRVSLKRNKDSDKKSTIFLVDEAHNLVERSRDMFSTDLDKNDVLNVRRKFKDNKSLYKELGKINSDMLSLKKLKDTDGELVIDELPAKFNKNITSFLDKAERWLSKNHSKEHYKDMLDLYFKINSFSRILRIIDSNYRIYFKRTSNNVYLKLFCIDPSSLLKDITSINRSTIYFSATLHPINYYKYILGSSEDDTALRLTSPFDSDNLKKSIYSISTKYKDRKYTILNLVDSISKEILNSDGNTLVFFPSFKYMNMFLDHFEYEHECFEDFDFCIQEPSMSEEKKALFLNAFESESKFKTIGFSVLGGLFSEGIDLRGDMLKKAIVVGVGIPKLSFERDLIMDYYNTLSSNGYDYAYCFPGFNKILQAAGRVIRTESDTGEVVLIDSRFLSYTYQRLLPDDYKKNFMLKK
ncbi:MAG: helicase C-terminal domain-containing protein [Acidaminobacteraceae bacterium]